MRMNTCVIMKVVFASVCSQVLVYNLEFCAQGNKTRILSLSLDGQEANGPCDVSRHRRMHSDGVLVSPPTTCQASLL